MLNPDQPQSASALTDQGGTVRLQNDLPAQPLDRRGNSVPLGPVCHPWAADPYATLNGLIKRSYVRGERAALLGRPAGDPTAGTLKHAHPVLATVLICGACASQRFRQPLSLKAQANPANRKRAGTTERPTQSTDHGKFTKPDDHLFKLGWYDRWPGEHKAWVRYLRKAPAPVWMPSFREERAMRWFIVVNHPASALSLRDRDLLCSLLPLVNEYGWLQRTPQRKLAHKLGRTSAKATLAHLAELAARVCAHGEPLLELSVEQGKVAGAVKPVTLVSIKLATIQAGQVSPDRSLQQVLDLADRVAAASNTVGESVGLEEEAANHLGIQLPSPFDSLLAQTQRLLDDRLIAGRGDKSEQQAVLSTRQRGEMATALRGWLCEHPDWAVEDALRAALRPPAKSEDFSGSLPRPWMQWVEKACLRACNEGPLCGAALESLRETDSQEQLDLSAVETGSQIFQASESATPEEAFMNRPRGIGQVDDEVESELERAAVAHRAGEYQQARKILGSLGKTGAFERVAEQNFNGDRRLARRCIYEAFARGHDYYLDPCAYQGEDVTYLPEWDWQADMQAEGLPAGRRLDELVAA